MIEPVRVLIWLAVSSKPQAEKDSNTDQLADARALIASREGWREAGVLEVPGHTREYIFYPDAERDVEAYAQLRQLAEARSFDVLWCRGRDRLGRTDALISQVEAIVRQSGAVVYSQSMPSVDVHTGQGDTMLAAIERGLAERELQEMRRRWHYGMRAKARKGYFIGVVPYGYRKLSTMDRSELVDCEPLDGKDHQDIIVYEPEARVVRLMFDLYEQGNSMYQVCARLRVLDSPQWYLSQVSRILRNPTYSGRVVFGARRRERNGGKVKRVRRTPLVDVPGRHTPIIDPEQFARVQALIRKKAKMSGRAAQGPYLLSGLVRCANCGHTMCVHTQTYTLKDGTVNRYTSYCCQTRRYQAGGKCNTANLSESVARHLIEAWITDIARDPAAYEEWLTGQLGEAQDNTREMVVDAIVQNQRARDLWDVQFEKGNISEGEWQEKRSRLSALRESLEQELVTLDDMRTRQAVIPSIEAFQSAPHLSDKKLRQFLMQIIDHFEWDGTTLSPVFSL